MQVPGLNEALRLNIHQGQDSGVSADIREKRIWEPYETELIVNNLSSGDVFLDIGANIGYYTVIASCIVGDKGKVIAYEPDPDNYSLLEENIKLNLRYNIKAFQAALSDTDGRGYLYLNPENRGDHQLYDAGEERHKVEIDIFNAADHLSNITSKVDFIKLDTQGSEFKIVSRLSDLISANSAQIKLIIELWPYGLRKAGSSGGDLLDLLFSFGLACNIIDHLNFQLFPAVRSDFNEWLTKTDSEESNKGFFNLILCPQTYSIRDFNQKNRFLK